MNNKNRKYIKRLIIGLIAINLTTTAFGIGYQNQNQSITINEDDNNIQSNNKGKADTNVISGERGNYIYDAKLIKSNSQLVTSAETARAKRSKSTLKDDVNQNTQNITDNKIVQSAINSNLIARTLAEVARATGIENDLRSDVDQNKQDISNSKTAQSAINSNLIARTLTEVARATGIENDLRSDVDQNKEDISNSKTVQSAINSKLIGETFAETVRAKKAESILKDDINQNIENITANKKANLAEVSRAKKAESILKDGINQNKQNITDNKTLQSAINSNLIAATFTETVRAKKAESILKDDIDQNKEDIHNYQSQLTQNKKTLDMNRQQLATNTAQLTANKNAMDIFQEDFIGTRDKAIATETKLDTVIEPQVNNNTQGIATLQTRLDNKADRSDLESLATKSEVNKVQTTANRANALAIQNAGELKGLLGDGLSPGDIQRAHDAIKKNTQDISALQGIITPGGEDAYASGQFAKDVQNLKSHSEDIRANTAGVAIAKDEAAKAFAQSQVAKTLSTLNQGRINAIEVKQTDTDGRLTKNEGNISSLQTDVINQGKTNTDQDTQISNLQGKTTNLDNRLNNVEESVSGIQTQLADQSNGLDSKSSKDQTIEGMSQIVGTPVTIDSNGHIVSGVDGETIKNLKDLTIGQGVNTQAITDNKDAQDDINTHLTSGIALNQSRLRKETRERKSAVTDLNSKVSENKETIETNLATNNTQSAAIQKNSTEIQSNTTGLGTEVTERREAIKDLDNKIFTNTTEIAKEVGERKSEVASLTGKIEGNYNEFSAYQTAQNLVNNNQDNAFNLYKGEQSTINQTQDTNIEANKIGIEANKAQAINNSKALFEEAKTREAAVTDLDNKISTNASGIEENQSGLTTEVTERKNAVASLKGEVEGNYNEFSAYQKTQNLVDNNQDNAFNLYKGEQSTINQTQDTNIAANKIGIEANKAQAIDNSKALFEEAKTREAAVTDLDSKISTNTSGIEKNLERNKAQDTLIAQNASNLRERNNNLGTIGTKREENGRTIGFEGGSGDLGALTSYVNEASNMTRELAGEIPSDYFGSNVESAEIATNKALTEWAHDTTSHLKDIDNHLNTNDQRLDNQEKWIDDLTLNIKEVENDLAKEPLGDLNSNQINHINTIENKENTIVGVNINSESSRKIQTRRATNPIPLESEPTYEETRDASINSGTTAWAILQNSRDIGDINNLNGNLKSTNGGAPNLIDAYNQLESTITQNQGVTATNTIKVDNNEKQITSNVTKIDNNANQIQENKSTITQNQATTATNAIKVDNNEKQITSNIAKIDNNTNQIQQNKSTITKNQAAIVTNTTKADNNTKQITNNIAKIDSNTNQIQQSKSSITKNQDSIATNETKIDNNTKQIASNTKEVENVKNVAYQQLTIQQSEIAGNTAAIKHNSNRISQVQSEARKGIANAAAMNAIKYPKLEKGEASVGAGYGSYKNANSIAIGIGVQATDNLFINSSAAATSGENPDVLVSAGASYKFKLF